MASLKNIRKPYTFKQRRYLCNFRFDNFITMGRPVLIDNKELTLSVDVPADIDATGVNPGDDNPLNGTVLLAVPQRAR